MGLTNRQYLLKNWEGMRCIFLAWEARTPLKLVRRRSERKPMRLLYREMVAYQAISGHSVREMIGPILDEYMAMMKLKRCRPSMSSFSAVMPALMHEVFPPAAPNAEVSVSRKRCTLSLEDIEGYGFLAVNHPRTIPKRGG